MFVADDGRSWQGRHGAPSSIARSLRWSLALIACTLAWFGAPSAQAETCTTYTYHATTGGTAHSWTFAGNWSPGGVPGASSKCDSVIISDAEEVEPYVLHVPADVTLSNLTLDGGTINSGGPLTVTGHFEWSNWASHGELNANGIEIPITVTGTTTVRGDLPKYIDNTGGNNSEQDYNGSLTLKGPTTVEDTGELVPLSSGEESRTALVNNSTLTLEPGAKIGPGGCCLFPAHFVNNAKIVVPASSSGSAAIEQGEFDDNGSLEVGAGTTLALEGGIEVLKSGDELGGGGALRMKYSELRLAGGLAFANGTRLEFEGPQESEQITGSGSFTGGGAFEWSGGAVTGELSVAGTLSTSIDGATNRKTVDGGEGAGKLTLDGPTTVSGEELIVNSGTVTNLGTLTVAGKVFVTNGGTLTQAGGSTMLEGGTLFSEPQPIAVTGGVLAGHGAIEASLANNGGTVRPAVSAPLQVTGGYTQSAGGTLEMDAEGSSPGAFGQLQVTGEASLAGTIDVRTLGGFAPARGQALEALTYGSRAGVFGAFAGGPLYGISYGATGADVVFGGAPPEFGRCVKVAAGKGKFKTSTCTSLLTSGSYEWTPGVQAGKAHFTSTGTATTLETTAGVKVTCKAASGSGEYTSPTTVGSERLVFTGCESAKHKCSAAGATSGELKSSPLEGSLGWVIHTGELKLFKVGLSLTPAGEAPVFEFECASTAYAITGGVIAALKDDTAPSVKSTVTYAQVKGIQKPEAFEGGSKNILETAIGSGGATQTGLKVTLTQTSAEPIETNAFA
jgi:hypothetical protein